MIETEISEMDPSIGAVDVRSFVPLSMTINCGCSVSRAISSCKILRTCSILGHLK